jgi:hypothetical protein
MYSDKVLLDPDLQYVFEVPLQKRIDASSSMLRVWLGTWPPVIKKFFPTPENLPLLSSVAQPVKAKKPPRAPRKRKDSRIYVSIPWVPSEDIITAVTKVYDKYYDKKDWEYWQQFPLLATTLQNANECDRIITRGRILDRIIVHREQLAALRAQRAKLPDPLAGSGSPETLDAPPAVQDSGNVDKDEHVETTSQQTADTTTPTPTRDSKRVAFTWRDWIYDSTGKCANVYSQWPDKPRQTHKYLQETISGNRLQSAQLESHKKFKKERRSHAVLLRSVEEEIRKQRTQKARQSKPTEKFHNVKRRTITRSTPSEKNPMTSSPEDTRVTSATPHSVQRIFTIPAPTQATRIPPLKGKHKTIKDSHLDKKPIKQHRPLESSPQQATTTPSFWKHDTRGVRALLQSPYLLPLPWQHHAWTAPAHRKTLRQQPFLP